jgi:hypothetical protein
MLVLAVLALGCMEPSKDEPFTPPPEYQVWYARVEQCSGVHGSFDRLRFFVLGAEDRRAGAARGHDIWIRAIYRETPFVVEHEILHSLIGDGDHTSWRWAACRLSVESVLNGG